MSDDRFQRALACTACATVMTSVQQIQEHTCTPIGVVVVSRAWLKDMAERLDSIHHITEIPEIAAALRGIAEAL